MDAEKRKTSLLRDIIAAQWTVLGFVVFGAVMGGIFIGDDDIENILKLQPIDGPQDGATIGGLAGLGVGSFWAINTPEVPDKKS